MALMLSKDKKQFMITRYCKLFIFGVYNNWQEIVFDRVDVNLNWHILELACLHGVKHCT